MKYITLLYAGDNITLSILAVVQSDIGVEPLRINTLNYRYSG